VPVFVDHLQLVDFRSYVGVDVALGAGVVIFVGANGQGKTNLVEAVEYLSTLSSHRVARASCSSRSRSRPARPTGRG
jgi:DNA replication and repair protein RecF